MLRLLIIALLTCSGHSWEMVTSHKQVTNGVTKDVTITCRYDNQNNGKLPITTMVGLTIHKFHDSQPWVTTAKIRLGEKDATVGDGIGSGATVKGHVGKMEDSILSLTWSLSTPNTPGQYACEINGYAKDDNLIKIITDPVSIIESRLSLQYLLGVILAVKEQSENNSNQSSIAFQSIAGLTKRVNVDLDAMKKDIQATRNMLINKGIDVKLTKEQIGPIVDSKLRDNWYERRYWPGGQYALLKPGAGCPSSTTSEFTSGYVKFHSETTQVDKYDTISQPNHLAKPVFEKDTTNNFVYIRTCKRATNATGPAWPKGSYCIHRVGGFCPVGFEEASIQMDAEDNPRLKGEFVNPPDVQMDTSFEYEVLFFCCRNDESPTTYITLPLDTSFYLYRFKGTCQNVKDAKVSGEWLQIRTENHSNQDRYNTKDTPDSTLNPLRLYLCYYQS